LVRITRHGSSGLMRYKAAFGPSTAMSAVGFGIAK
jgi:hypothetical protein